MVHFLYFSRCPNDNSPGIIRAVLVSGWDSCPAVHPSWGLCGPGRRACCPYGLQLAFSLLDVFRTPRGGHGSPWGLRAVLDTEGEYPVGQLILICSWQLTVSGKCQKGCCSQLQVDVACAFHSCGMNVGSHPVPWYSQSASTSCHSAS